MRGLKVTRWIILVLVIGLKPQQASGLSLEDDFRIQLKRGITFFFSGGPDEGVCLTLRGSIATFRYLDGMKADGSLQKLTNEGSVSFSNNRVTLSGNFLQRKITLQLKPFPSKYASGSASKARFLLIGPDLPSGGYGPVEMPLKRRSPPFVIKKS